MRNTYEKYVGRILTISKVKGNYGSRKLPKNEFEVMLSHLGKVSDSVIAREYGYSRERIRQLRNKYLIVNSLEMCKEAQGMEFTATCLAG